MEKRGPKEQASDGARNLGEMRRWADRKGAWGNQVTDFYLDQVNRKWRSLGRQARQPASLRGAEHHT